MLKKKSVIFIIILILCFVGYQYIYPNYQKSLINGKVKEQIQSDFISPLQQDLKTCGFEDVTVSPGSLEKNLDFEEYKSYYFSIIVSSDSLEDYEDIETNEDLAKELFFTMKEMDHIYQSKYSVYRDRLVLDDESTVQISFKSDTGYFSISGNDHSYGFDDHSSCFSSLSVDKEPFYIYWKDTNEYEYFDGPDPSHCDISTPSQKEDKPKQENSTNSSAKGSAWSTYNDGYNAVIEDGDYNYDLYSEDSDYRNGVDDALDEMGEDY